MEKQELAQLTASEQQMQSKQQNPHKKSNPNINKEHPHQKSNPNINKEHHQTAPFSELIISMMKKIRKNSALFKPIKKLKTSIQVIGGEGRISLYQPSSTLIVFHFGLGNELDKQIIMNATSLPLVKLKKEFVVLPGKPFSFIDFAQVQEAYRFIEANKFGCILEQLAERDMPIGEDGQKKQESDMPIGEANQKEQEPNDCKQALVYYSNLKHNNIQRTMIFFYLNSSQSSQHNSNSQPLIAIPNCPSNYGPQNRIPGLHLIQQIITKQEQLHLLQWLDQQPWQKLSNRRVQHYGFQFKYGLNGVDKHQHYKNLIPKQLHFLLQRLKQIVALIAGFDIDYDQLTVNDYFAGHGIPPHFDTHSPFQDYFVALSMLSGIVMDWKRYDGTQKSTYLKERSVVVFSEQARYAWLHSIACRKLDNVDGQLKHRSRRISLTFRKIRRTPCVCKYNFYCDSQGYDQSTMKKNNPLLKKYMCEENKQKLKGMNADEIYKEYVTKAYNSFGYDFHNKVIPEVKQYLSEESLSVEESQECKLVLDIGCGNGEYKRHLESDKFYYIGVERCEVMLAVEDEVHMDGLRLGFGVGRFDVVLVVAVLHHFVTEQDRLQCLKEARRVMADNGVMYVTVFSYEGKKDEYPEQDILLEYCLPGHKAIGMKKEENKKAIDMKEETKKIIGVKEETKKEIDLKEQTKKTSQTKQKKGQIQRQSGKQSQKGQIYSRYYHLFRRDELQSLIEEAGLRVEEMKTSKENMVAKLRKVLDIK